MLTIIPLDDAPRIQRPQGIHDVPRGWKRFRESPPSTWNPADADGELLPLVLVNPMDEHRAATAAEFHTGRV